MADARCGFADDFKQPNDGKLQQSIRFQIA